MFHDCSPWVAILWSVSSASCGDLLRIAQAAEATVGLFASNARRS
jgi:hypothetical protein